MKKLRCSICEEIITPDPDGWDGGHNAEPINSGKCCGFCNARIVEPTQILVFNAINLAKESKKGELR